MGNAVRTVLVVDDDPAVREVLEALLKEHGFDVVTAADGNEALEKLPKHPIDAVLLDVIMPDKDGVETLVAIKRARPEIFVISMSGGGHRKDAAFLAAARRFGADAVLAKPFQPGELVRLLREWLVGRVTPGTAMTTQAAGPRYSARSSDPRSTRH